MTHLRTLATEWGKKLQYNGMISVNDLINNPLSEGFISLKDFDALWTSLIDILEYLVSSKDHSSPGHLLEIKKKKLSQVISDIYLKLQMVANVANQICGQIHKLGGYLFASDEDRLSISNESKKVKILYPEKPDENIFVDIVSSQLCDVTTAIRNLLNEGCKVYKNVAKALRVYPALIDDATKYLTADDMSKLSTEASKFIQVPMFLATDVCKISYEVTKTICNLHITINPVSNFGDILEINLLSDAQVQNKASHESKKRRRKNEVNYFYFKSLSYL